MTRLISLGVAALIGIVLLWLTPTVGFVAVAVLLVVLPPWGRTYAERAVISGIVLLGAIAVFFPRASSTPIDSVTARIFLTSLLIFAAALYAIPQLRKIPQPKPRLIDVVLLGVAGGLFYWLISGYLGVGAEQLLAGLFFSGWDNHGHFTTFANTYAANSTTWSTIDGSIAWNQWYPSLHTTLWALMEYASGSNGVGRVELLFPYIQWSALTFALSMTALAWLASDLAGRLVSQRGSKRATKATAYVAAGGTGIWIFLGSPQFLFNSAFTNFALGVAVVTTASYLSVRSWRSARTLGWFLIPVAAIAVIGLWTPLVVALVPAGVVAAVALVKLRPILGAAWLAANVVVASILAWQQGSAILSAEGGASAGEFAQTIGAVGTGMAPFNIAAGIAAPFVAVAIAVALRRHRPLAWGIAAPSVMTGLLAVAFIPGTSAAGVSPIQSYYVLKALDAAMLATAPLLAAAAATAVVFLIRFLDTATAIAVGAAATISLVAAFGYVGATPPTLSAGFSVAPGVQASQDRNKGIQDPLIGESILSTVSAVEDLTTYSPMMWDGAGTLPNLWAGSLHGTLSARDQTFYVGLPTFPYGEDTYAYMKESLDADSDLRLAVTWFRQTSGEFLTLRLKTADPRQVVVVEVPMRQSLLCPECAS